jgi:hypothetical protein
MDTGQTAWEEPRIEAWQPWSPDEAAAQLQGASVPWCVVGGWAVDLFVGAPTRDHHDLEIAVTWPHLEAIRRRLGAHGFYAVDNGRVLRLAPGEEPSPPSRQHWVFDDAAGAWRMDVMVEPGDDDWWVFRRDERIRVRRSKMIARTESNICYLRPEGVLLYKAKASLAKDWADLDRCLACMDDRARAWLHDALRLAHPGHPWLAVLP